MIDLHSHLLPGIDDGAQSLEQAVATLQQFAQEGVTDLALTPHLDASELGSRGEEAVAARQEVFEQLLLAAPVHPRLHLGFEIMLDRSLPATADRRFAIAQSRYYLVEFSYAVAPQAVTRDVVRMIEADLVPIVAHPERYHRCGVAALRSWREHGARIQLDANTFTKTGRRASRARAYLEAGLADILAADNHGDRSSLAAGRLLLESCGFAQQGELLTVVNPSAILEDGVTEAVPPIALPRLRVRGQ